jgi:prepilin-type N-terminal cleavage/methylation domain-containing protein
MRLRGLTLIELLVVLAIIAILAAIALPSFLQAQERAKVSRAQADLRTVVTALETYRIDWNVYPTYHYTDAGEFQDDILEFHIGGNVSSIGAADTDWDGRNPLTTPIAYVTSMPRDPFASHRGGGPDEVREYLYVNWPYALQRAQGSFWTPIFFDTFQAYGPYRLHSRGPDLDGPDSGVPYDPTNGHGSDGDITYGPNTGFSDFKFFPWRRPDA